MVGGLKTGGVQCGSVRHSIRPAFMPRKPGRPDRHPPCAGPTRESTEVSASSVVLRRGDYLDCLTELDAEASGRGVLTREFEEFVLHREGEDAARALIVGVDLSECDRVREVKRSLRRIEQQIDDSCALLEGDAHVYVVIKGGAARSSRVLPIYETLAEKLHMLAGSSHGIEISSTVIDCTDCEDKTLLARRIMGDVTSTSADEGSPASALQWRELADSSICEASLSDYL
ncbi:hypothetical protein ATJ78_1085 [Paramicrobacterium agarici]|uniref:Uncharacterized protein n=1 Tax=Paramicrobacterium agarici TaxID=630514 RepID=A0A2A9DU85_9MICO|nr:hypothetical protein ATJ78_1085 [Microbacterium agarici]